MVNHPNRSSTKVEITTAGQGLSFAYLDGKLAAGFSVKNGRWVMYRLERRAGRNEVIGPERLDVSGIFHNTQELHEALRLFMADPAGLAAAWPASGLRAQCKDAIDKLSA